MGKKGEFEQKHAKEAKGTGDYRLEGKTGSTGWYCQKLYEKYEEVSAKV